MNVMPTELASGKRHYTGISLITQVFFTAFDVKAVCDFIVWLYFSAGKSFKCPVHIIGFALLPRYSSEGSDHCY